MKRQGYNLKDGSHDITITKKEYWDIWEVSCDAYHAKKRQWKKSREQLAKFPNDVFWRDNVNEDFLAMVKARKLARKILAL